MPSNRKQIEENLFEQFEIIIPSSSRSQVFDAIAQGNRKLVLMQQHPREENRSIEWLTGSRTHRRKVHSIGQVPNREQPAHVRVARIVQELEQTFSRFACDQEIDDRLALRAAGGNFEH